MIVKVVETILHIDIHNQVKSDEQTVSQFAQDKGGFSLHYVDLKAFLETNKVASQTQFKLVKNG